MKQKLIILPADSHIDLDLVFDFEKNSAFFKVNKRERDAELEPDDTETALKRDKDSQK